MAKFKVTMVVFVEADNEDDAIMSGSNKAGYGHSSVEYEAEKLDN